MALRQVITPLTCTVKDLVSIHGMANQVPKSTTTRRAAHVITPDILTTATAPEHPAMTSRAMDAAIPSHHDLHHLRSQVSSLLPTPHPHRWVPPSQIDAQPGTVPQTLGPRPPALPAEAAVTGTALSRLAMVTPTDRPGSSRIRSTVAPRRDGGRVVTMRPDAMATRVLESPGTVRGKLTGAALAARSARETGTPKDITVNN